MLRRKKLAKQRKNRQPENKKPTAYEKMVADAIASSKARKKSGQSKREWQEDYVKGLREEERGVALSETPFDGHAHKHAIDDTKWKRPYRDDETMALREKAAQDEVDRKRLRVAPAYNKGPVQFLTDGTDPTDIGKKK